jgi:RNA polymerase sigma factor (TIGR02999 family)
MIGEKRTVHTSQRPQDGSLLSVDSLFPAAYDELRHLARGYLWRERPGHTLQPTALVHEMYLKLADQTRVRWKSKSHFIAVGAIIMRQLLVDHSRRCAAAKRGAGWHKISLTHGFDLAEEEPIDHEQLVSLNAALDKLASVDERSSRVVVLRLFGGLSHDEIGDALGVCRRTVTNDWRHAVAWLGKELGEGWR